MTCSTAREWAEAFQQWCVREGGGLGSDDFVASLELTIRNATRDVPPVGMAAGQSWETIKLPLPGEDS